MQSRWCSLVALLALAWSCGAEQQRQQPIPPLPTDVSNKSYPCDSEIYCHGELLHTVQMASIFPDSKTFVDMKMRWPAKRTLELFGELMRTSGGAPSRGQVERFVNESFEAASSEFVAFDPPDWVAEPGFLRKVLDPQLRKFGADLNHIWKLLGRRMKEEVRAHSELYSIIFVEQPVIVPGGRFREFYYWDSYWIVKGLLHSEMRATVRGMLDNFASIVERFGFIPNGGRIYYSMRSQPPMLHSMVHEYLRHTRDLAWLERNLHLLEREFDFWMRERTVRLERDGRNYTLAHYSEGSFGPRPESYREDYLTSQSFRTPKEKDDYWAELKTAAETGWDFSSRWFILDGTNKGNLTNLKTRSIVPVDLNALLYRNARLLADFHRRLGNASRAEHYEARARDWLEAVEALLWHDEVGAWLDYDMLNDLKRDYFYPTNVLPLWAGCYRPERRQEHVGKVLKYLERSQIMLNLGGIPSTLEHSGEQWDYPNAWPPLQYFVIMSLDSSGDAWAQRLAFEISQRWVRSNYKAFNETNSMFEKYDATVSGGHGGGGEYEVQLGFGWSNGLVLDLLDKYGDRLTADNHFAAGLEPGPLASLAAAHAPLSTAAQLMAGLLALVTSLAAGFIGLVVYKRRHYYRIADTSGPGRRSEGGRRKQSLQQQQQQQQQQPPPQQQQRRQSRNYAYTELKNINNE